MNRLDKETALRIASGQVIVDFSSVVKELLENALDSGAKIIEIRLQESGVQALEISDNGHGILSNDFAALCRRNHTSKLTALNELACVTTFGFRGEALSSLCALCELCITTRHTTAAYAHRLEFDRNGTITKQTKQARTPGTTVAVQRLFHSIPVRQREFVMNSRVELSRMLTTLYAYAVGVQGVKIICSNHSAAGGSSVLLQSYGHASLRENVVTVFGQNTLTNLVEFRQPTTPPSSLMLPNELCEEFSLTVDEVVQNANVFKFEGLISSCEHGRGHSSRERQYIFLNRRPSKIPSLTTLLNQTYRQFNAQQYPFVVLNITAPREDIDVNITPSKNEVMMKKERLLLYYAKTVLVEMYNNMPLNLRCNTMMRPNATSIGNDTSFDSVASSSSSKTNGRPVPSSGRQSQLPSDWVVPIVQQQPVADELVGSGMPNSGDAASGERRRRRSSNTSEGNGRNRSGGSRAMATDAALPGWVNFGDVQQVLDSSSALNATPNRKRRSGEPPRTPNSTVKNLFDDVRTPSRIAGLAVRTADEPSEAPTTDERNISSAVYSTDKSVRSPPCVGDIVQSAQKQQRHHHISSLLLPCDVSVVGDDNASQHFGIQTPACTTERASSEFYQNDEAAATSLHAKPLAKLRCFAQKPTIVPLRAELLFSCMQTTTFPTRTKQLSQSSSSSQQQTAAVAETDQTNQPATATDELRFHAQITPSQNEQAEQELRLFLQPRDFLRMQVLGQFNRGFIVTCLEDEHIFVVDQHASDERYQLELLQRYPRLEGQRLLQPQALTSLTAADELMIEHRLDVLERFGFQFERAAENEPGRRLLLVRAPAFEDVVLGRDDVRDMVAMLLDTNGALDAARYPPKLERLFAMRACKRAVKIGMHLKLDEMRRVVAQLAECREPWKCAHGRPTVRHLLALSHMEDLNSPFALAVASAVAAASEEMVEKTDATLAMPGNDDEQPDAAAAAKVGPKPNTTEKHGSFYTDSIVQATTSFDSVYFRSQATLRIADLVGGAAPD